MQTPVYRIAVLADVPELVRLRVLMQSEVHEASEPPPGFAAISEAYFRRALAEGSYLSVVAESEGRLVAANGLVVYRKPPSFEGLGGYLGYIGNVFTEKSWRGRGLGTELMRRLVEAARATGVEKLHLCATEDGNGVYRRVGFKPSKYEYLEMSLRDH
jgi:GNAT superfamily N-acetyltransferase